MATVRLDPKTEASLKRLAKKRGQSQSEVIRDAIDQLARPAGDAETEPTAYDRLQPFLGIADSGGRDLSNHTGQKFATLLK